MPDGTFIGPEIHVGIYQRHDDGYLIGVSIALDIGVSIPISVTVTAHTAIRLAETIIKSASDILSQSAATCGCDAKADWICEHHEAAYKEITERRTEGPIES